MDSCPACTYKNLPGADECEQCGTTLMQKPDKKTATKSIYDSIQKAGMRSPILVKPNTTAKEVVKKMKEKNIGCALVLDGNQFEGIFTERDVLQRLAKPELDLNEIEIRNVMTPTPQVLKDTDSIAFALNIMAMGNFRHVPVVSEDGSYGVFSVRDALHYFF